MEGSFSSPPPALPHPGGDHYSFPLQPFVLPPCRPNHVDCPSPIVLTQVFPGLHLHLLFPGRGLACPSVSRHIPRWGKQGNGCICIQVRDFSSSSPSFFFSLPSPPPPFSSSSSFFFAFFLLMCCRSQCHVSFSYTAKWFGYTHTSIYSFSHSFPFSFSLCMWHIAVHICMCVLSCFSRAQLFATPWTIACQAPLSMG